MPALESRVVPQSNAYRQNYATLTGLIDRLRTLEDYICDKSGASRARSEQRGQPLPHDRPGRLLDAGAPFLGLPTLADFYLDHTGPVHSIPGGGFIAGIGWVSGVRVMIIVDDAGIDVGVAQPIGIEKLQHVQTIALKRKLSFIHLVESAGANLLTYRVETFTHGGSGFYWLARLSTVGISVISIAHGSSTAGGAHMPGLPDYIVMVRDRVHTFPAGPPLLKVATGEVAIEEELGGAEMHITIPGLTEYLAKDDAGALRIVCELVAVLDWDRDVPVSDRFYASPRFDAEELLGIALTDHRKPLDMHKVITCFTDGLDFLESRSDHDPGTITGHAAICGMHVGAITNNGPLDPAGTTKAAHFIQVCCRSDTPLLYLQSTTGSVVGRASEQAGIIKHGSKTAQAAASAIVPHVTMHCGASFGAGNYGMSGHDFFSDFCFS